MRPRFFSRLLFIFGACTLLLLVALTGTGLTQTDVPSGPLGFVKMSPVALGDSAQALDPESLLVFPAGATTSKGTLPADLTSAGKGPGTATQTMSVGAASSPIGGVIPGLDTVPTFAGAFAAQAGPRLGGVFPFIMVGNDPRVGGTTRIRTQMTAVSLRLLKPDGSVMADMPYAPFEDLVEDSPNFAEADYTSGHTSSLATPFSARNSSRAWPTTGIRSWAGQRSSTASRSRSQRS